jgi:hypothetical protein
VTDAKILEVAGVLTAGFIRKGVPLPAEEIYQEAALQALETAEKYGHKMRGNPFSYLALCAGADTKIATIKQLVPVTISEFAAAGRVRGLNVYDLQHRDRVDDVGDRRKGGRKREDDVYDRPEITLRGELERLRAVTALMKRLPVRERRLVVAAMEEGGGDIDGLARRCKVPRRKATGVIRRFVRAVGDDPAVEHLRRVISAA